MIVAYFINYDKPMRIKCKNLGLWVILGMLIIYLILTTIFHPLQQDEGVFLTIGQNLVKGYLPYRDFFDHKPPGIYWLFTGINLVFGNNIIWYKIILIVTNLGSTWLIYKVVQALACGNTIKGDLRESEDQASAWESTPKRGLQENSRSSFSLFALIFFLWLTLVFEGQHLIAEPFVAFFLLLGLFIYIRYCHCAVPAGEQEPFNLQKAWQSILMMIVGLFFGLALLFKQTAILSALAFLIFLTWQRQWKQMAYFCLGIFIPILLTILYLWHYNLLSLSYQEIILYNFQYYPSENFFRVLDLLAIPFLYTLPVWILFTIGIIRLLRSNNRFRNNKILLIFLLAILPILSFFGRHYPHYWLQSAPFVAILASITLKGDLRAPGAQALACYPSLKAALKKYGVQALACYLIISSSILTYNFLFSNLSKYLDEQKLTQFLQQQNQPIYAENQFIGLYFLTQKTPPNRFLYITEVDDWSEQAEQKTIEQLSGNVDLIVWPDDDNYAYARDLQKYIFTHYKPIFRQDKLGVVVYSPRKDSK